MSEPGDDIPDPLPPDPWGGETTDHDDGGAVGPDESALLAEGEGEILLPAPIRGGGAWTIPLLCAGIGMIACCVIIPEADVNRRMAYERQQLQADLDFVRKQIDVNERFLERVVEDPNLAERLAQRQLRKIRDGTQVLRVKGVDDESDAGGGGMSPFQLVNVSPPPPQAPYRPLGGRLANLCYNPRSRLYLMGGGLMLLAAGLVLGAGPIRCRRG